jgi:hypothetical protein
MLFQRPVCLSGNAYANVVVMAAGREVFWGLGHVARR